jgi:serine/threonine-protein kinase
VLGTPYYMSPEQARGLRSVDFRSDLWSVGVIAYRCIVGVLPFEGEAVGDLLVKLCTAPLPVPSQLAPDVPPGFDAWFARALTREPEGRFSNASELAESLAAVCGIPVRGSYSTGDIPIPSFASGPMGHSSPAITPGPGAMTPAPGVMPVAPYQTADRTGPNPAVFTGNSAATLQMAATGAPTTATPAPVPSRNTGALVAAAAAAVLVLGIGAAVLVKVLGSGGEPPITAAPPVAAPVVPQAPAVAAPKPIEPVTPQVVTTPTPSAAPVPSVAVAKPGRPAAPFPVAHPGKPGGKPGKPGGQPAPGGADVGF